MGSLKTYFVTLMRRLLRVGSLVYLSFLLLRYLGLLLFITQLLTKANPAAVSCFYFSVKTRSRPLH